ncbi:MAG: tail fiber protein [Muribaculaceae bacterium]|nr:tail fiber protein [Muribaculaceae bacterium]
MTEFEYKQLLDKMRAELLPIGTILIWPSQKIPTEFMLCDGRELSKSNYKHLFDLIGFTFGGDGNTRFRLPDLRGRFVRGYDAIGNVDPNREFGSLQDDSIQNHNHKVNSCSENGLHQHYLGFKNLLVNEANTFYTGYTYSFPRNYGATDNKGNLLTDKDGKHRHEIEVGEVINGIGGPVNVGVETRPKNVALNFCIKVK